MSDVANGTVEIEIGGSLITLVLGCEGAICVISVGGGVLGLCVDNQIGRVGME